MTLKDGNLEDLEIKGIYQAKINDEVMKHISPFGGRYRYICGEWWIPLKDASDILHETREERMKTKVTDLSIDDAVCFKHELGECLVLYWSANIGFGQVMISRDNGDHTWRADTESMCAEDDKEFLRMVLNQWVEQIEVEG